MRKDEKSVCGLSAPREAQANSHDGVCAFGASQVISSQVSEKKGHASRLLLMRRKVLPVLDSLEAFVSEPFFGRELDSIDKTGQDLGIRCLQARWPRDLWIQAGLLWLARMMRAQLVTISSSSNGSSTQFQKHHNHSKLFPRTNICQRSVGGGMAGHFKHTWADCGS
eukprot:s92_g51.t1